MKKILTPEALSHMKANIQMNLDYYYSDKVWIHSFLERMPDVDQDKIEAPVKLKMPTGKTDLKDYENIVLLYTALKDMNLSLAINEGIWTYMTHVTYWEYMRKRWPLEDSPEKFSSINYIKNRYFFGEKGRIRNGLARLWWTGYITYDETTENHFELTEVLLKGKDRQELSRMILETPALARNKKAVKVILRTIKNLEDDDSFKIRDFIRDMAKYVNFIGSVTLWDSLDEIEINRLIQERTNKWGSSKIKINV